MNLDRVINALYLVLRPEGGSWRSARGWFLSELNERGLDVSRSTLHDWITGEVPDDRLEAVQRVVFSLYFDAHAKRLAELQSLAEVVSDAPSTD